MTYLISGGTGLVGSFLIDNIQQRESFDMRDYLFICRSLESQKKIEQKGLKTIKADLTDSESLKNAILDVDVVINLASLADDWAQWSELYKVNVLGVKNLIKACISSNTDTFLVHTSSTGVHGHYIPEIPIDESFPFNPTSIYQRSKYLQEKEIWDFSKENGWKNFSILRPPSVIGPRDTKTLLPIFNAVWQNKFPVLKGGNGYSTFIHPYDLSKALLLVAENPEKTRGQAYNLKSFECLLKDFLQLIVDTVTPPAPPKEINYYLVYSLAVLSEIYAKVTGRPTTLNRYRVTKFSRSRRYIDKKIKNHLGFNPEKDLKTTITESYEWFVTNNKFPPS
ncbi:NAD-dependent epimerase/dehydratase family protein [Candidatus Hodarchaeum mangrovi]